MDSDLAFDLRKDGFRINHSLSWIPLISSLSNTGLFVDEPLFLVQARADRKISES